MNNKKTALVTGASSGFGKAFAELLASEGYNLVITARSREKLQKVQESIQRETEADVFVIVKDLASDKSAEEIYNEVSGRNISIDVLVNNAGFATFGSFHETDLDKERNEIHVNVVALTELTKLFLPQMIERNDGRVLNIASTAAFQPGPLMAVYYATKSYVLSFSTALAEELSHTNITVSTLCPGATKTGFQERAAMQKSRLVQSMDLTVEQVVNTGYNGLLKGKRIIIPGFRHKLAAWILRVLPNHLQTKIVSKAQKSIEE